MLSVIHIFDHSKYCKEYEKWGIKVFSGAENINKHNLSGQPLENLKMFQVGTFNIVPFSVEHDVPDCFGYVIASRMTGDQLLFATDTYFVRYRFANLTHIMLECNFDRETLSETVDDRHLERVFESHMSLQDLKLMLKANDLSKVEAIYLLHASQDNLDPHKAKREIQELTGLPVYLCAKNGGFV